MAEAAPVVQVTEEAAGPGWGPRDGEEGQVQGAFRREPARPAGWGAGRKGGRGCPVFAQAWDPGGTGAKSQASASPGVVTSSQMLCYLGFVDAAGTAPPRTGRLHKTVTLLGPALLSEPTSPRPPQATALPSAPQGPEPDWQRRPLPCSHKVFWTRPHQSSAHPRHLATPSPQRPQRRLPPVSPPVPSAGPAASPGGPAWPGVPSS